MKTTDIVRMASKNAFRSKLRTTLTVLSLFVGAFTLTLTTALGAGVNDYVERQVATLSNGDILLVSPAATVETGDGPTEYDPDGRQQGAAGNPLTSGTLLNSDDIEAIEQIDGVRNVEAISGVTVDWIAESGSSSDARYEIDINPTSSIGQSDLVAGEQLDQESSQDQIVLPEEFVDALGFSGAEESIGKTVALGYTDAAQQEQEVTATVVGIARESLFAAGAGANSALTTVIADAQSADGAPDAWPLAVAQLQPEDGETVTAEEIQRVKDDLADADLAGQTIEDQLGIVQTIINGIIGVLNAFAVVALVAASFGIINTLLMSVQERTREIGLMKAMGMSNARVFTLFSLEAVFIGFLGSVIGALVAIGLGSVLSVALADTVLSALPGLQILLFTPANVIGVIVIIMLIAFLAGVLPARRAARQDPIESLRYE
ncbi:putative ABC transport system permease protein [Microbacterium sp. SLBN-154]|uniref:ABC transporter permease n=1 Tax=Microbacterium sp. SLBN-154 TaxID=2768458 RepID=UPI0011549A5C|nr:ABC transporter permease [Microbacterium sp. SLBN-154]TQK17605.1 putative ABC transport system permease protein [Microbacterium sp. SLBN-154]